MRILALFAVLAVGCTQYPEAPIVGDLVLHHRVGAAAAAAAALTANAAQGVYVEAHTEYVLPQQQQSGISKTSAPAISTQGPGRVLLVAAMMNQWNPVTMSISDTAGLTWTSLGTQVTNEQDQSEGTNTAGLWYAVAPNALSNDVVTVTYSAASGAGISVWALGGAAAPQGPITKIQDPNPAFPQATLSAPPGSMLFGASVDVAGAGGVVYTPMANTNEDTFVGYADNLYAFWWSGPTAATSTTFGNSGANATPRDFGGLAIAVPPSTPVSPPDGGTDAGTPDAGTPDAGSPDAGSDGGICTCTCQ